MSRAIGGYVRRCERVKGTIVRFGQYARAWDEVHLMFQTAPPKLIFEPFDVPETVDTRAIPTLRLPHGTSTF